MVTLKMYRDACIAVVMHCPDDYAKACAQAALGFHDRDARQRAADLLFRNTTDWQGNVARDARKALRRYRSARP